MIKNKSAEICVNPCLKTKLECERPRRPVDKPATPMSSRPSCHPRQGGGRTTFWNF